MCHFYECEGIGLPPLSFTCRQVTMPKDFLINSSIHDFKKISLNTAASQTQLSINLYMAVAGFHNLDKSMGLFLFVCFSLLEKPVLLK